MSDKNQNTSRRNFIKITSLSGIGAILINDPWVKLFANTLGIPASQFAKTCFSCELFRESDLLNLKYFFYNARLKEDYILPENSSYPLYIYVQLPAQHIGEELERYPEKIKERSDFKKKNSFLGEKSRLGFKLREGLNKLHFTQENLLNWSDNFQLVTIDDFARREMNTVVGYSGAIKRIKDEFQVLDGNNMLTWHQNFANNQDVLVPLTKFELPYKMFLSPIAEPYIDKSSLDFKRQYGEHEFLHNNKIGVEYSSKNLDIRIIRPWENQLVFRNSENLTFHPRLKVVKWLCQETDDNDTTSDLIPAPIHREELHELTMKPEFDRDVVSSLFKISALGGTVNMKYKNDDPLEFSTVAWEQKVKHARDNYVSVTFRAIDTFTGIKLLVSILTDRNYKFGISFLPKLYYISYAENYKDYTKPITVSKVPFVKIIPKTKGIFFTPQKVRKPPVPGSKYTEVDNGYVVGDGDAFNEDRLNRDKIFSFEYIGIDKDGKEHNFQSKIIFIPAEKYEIKFGEYNANCIPAAKPCIYKKGDIVAIENIGLLNPSRQEKYRNSQYKPCGEDVDANYWYALIKTFQKSEEPKLKETLEGIKKHVTQNLECYKINILGDMTYAKLDMLKQDEKVIKDDGKIENKESLIRKDSTNATFNTRDILLFTELNTELKNNLDTASDDVLDNFLDDNPLVASLVYSNVVISQIDKMEGKSSFRKVKFAPSYLNSNRDIDQNDKENKVKLLFELTHPITDFFSDNYRSAGAVANLGMTISHVSVLNQSIAYNESHNDSNKGLITTDGKIKSTSIFGGQKAEILGIPLMKIIDEFLPIEDLPVFNYLQQAEQSVLKLQQLVNEYKEMADEWIIKYNTVKKELEGYIEQFKNLDKNLKQLLENNVRAWLESIIEQSGTVSYYNNLQSSLTELKSQYDKYRTDILKKVDEALKLKLDLSSEINAVINEVSQKNIEALLKRAKGYPAEYFKETIKYYCINTLSVSPEINEKLESVIKYNVEIDKIYQEHYNAFVTGYAEATVFAQEFIKKQEDKVLRQVVDMRHNINSSILSALPEGFNPEKLDKILLIYKIVETYSYFHKIYQDLKEDHYSELMKKLNIPMPVEVLSELEKKLTEKLTHTIYTIVVPAELKGFKEIIMSTLKAEANCLRNYDRIYRDILKKHIDNALKPYFEVITEIDEKYEDLKTKIQLIKGLIDLKGLYIRNFVQLMVEEAKNKLEEQKRLLLNQIKGSDDYKKIQGSIAEIQALLKKVQEISKQKLEYNYRTKKFKKASIGNVIEFVPKNSELTVNVAYEIEFDISEFDSLPKVKKQSFKTESTLTEFKIGLLQLLYVDFERVQFISGSDVKDDFKVKIRDVQFAGCLSFVQAFQEFLSTISDNLVFDISATGARIGYGFSIPDFSAGYFNFFNFNLSALLSLPFNPKEAMQIQFGFGSPLNKFGLTVSGIFGGQGYFNLIAEPRRGIVGMEIVLEFGAIYNLNLTVAKGTVYLVGGIYIKRYDGKYLTKAYILCVGRFNVLGIFSASITFYLGLEGDGPVLKGVCIVTVSKRFSRFFEISVRCQMEKTIKGGKSQENNQQRFITLNAGLKPVGIRIEDTNLDRDTFYNDEYLYLTLYSLDAETPLILNITKSDLAGVLNETFRFIKYNGYDGGLAYIRLKLSDMEDGDDYQLSITKGDTKVLSHTFSIYSSEKVQCENQEKNSDVSTREYYASYFNE
jgi:hypothetical protein